MEVWVVEACACGGVRGAGDEFRGPCTPPLGCYFRWVCVEVEKTRGHECPRYLHPHAVHLMLLHPATAPGASSSPLEVEPNAQPPHPPPTCTIAGHVGGLGTAQKATCSYELYCGPHVVSSYSCMIKGVGRAHQPKLVVVQPQAAGGEGGAALVRWALVSIDGCVCHLRWEAQHI